jgi:hypothetical protein
MKKIYLIVLLTTFTLCISAQDKKFRGFFGPVDSELFAAKPGQRVPTSAWLFRPVVSVTAMQFNLEKPTTVTSLSSLGTGISYSHFVEANGEPYCNYAFNFLALFGTEIADISPLELSLAATVSAFQYISVGVGYNFSNKNLFLLTGVSFNFNK